MQMDTHLELADVADRTFALHHFVLVQGKAGSRERVGNVTRADRSEQLAFGTGIGLDRDTFRRIKLGLARFGTAELLIGLGFVLGAA